MRLKPLQRKMGPMALIGMILVCNGTFLIVILFLIMGIQMISSSGMRAASGIILSCENDADGCAPVVSFRTASGEPITFQPDTRSSTFAPGESVPVLYPPTHPHDAQIDPRSFFSGEALFGGGTGLVLFLIGTLLFLFARNHPSVELLHRYFLALEAQDYVTAWECLSPHMKILEGVPLTPDSFTRMQQALDRRQGAITRHTLTWGWSMIANQASFTVKVTRGESTSKIYPHVVREGSQWKILRFDPFRANLLH